MYAQTTSGEKRREKKRKMTKSGVSAHFDLAIQPSPGFEMAGCLFV